MSHHDHDASRKGGDGRASQVADRIGPNVPFDIVPLLRCGKCGAGIEVRGDEVACANRHTMAFADGYLDGSLEPRSGAEARTLESFGYEWNSFHMIQPEDEEFWRRYFADVNLEELRGCIAVDIGCGKGRYTRFTARHVKGMIALDGSDAVRSAVKNLQDQRNSLVIKAAIESMPLASSSFGLVSCLGVLHHLEDPRAGFDRIVDLMAPGGILLLYLYSRPSKPGLRAGALAMARFFRLVSVRIPHRWLRTMSFFIALLLYACFVVPGRIGRLCRINRFMWLPLAFYYGKPLRSLWLDTFDRLSAPIEHRYIWPELKSWFTSAGLIVQSVREESGLFIVARRPS